MYFIYDLLSIRLDQTVMNIETTILPSSSRECYSCNLSDSGTTTNRSVYPRVLCLKLWYMYHYWYAEEYILVRGLN